jgi:hypothetical protein
MGANARNIYRNTTDTNAWAFGITYRFLFPRWRRIKVIRLRTALTTVLCVLALSPHQRYGRQAQQKAGVAKRQTQKRHKHRLEGEKRFRN